MGPIVPNPPPSARTELDEIDRACFLQEQILGRDGTFVFVDLPPGDYALTVGTDLVDPSAFGDPAKPADWTREADPWSDVDPIILGPNADLRIDITFPGR